ncbi:type I polyketide synthase, partial [Catenulispora subtropica]|uniref:type I polyketide synthase n=1 Tax=Catenulispora subtropica TaxID=450798 RepID=UPI0031DBDE8C
PATADFAAHSPRVEPIEPELRRELASIAPQTGDVAFYSTARGQWLHGGDLDAGYWYANVREQVRFADAVVDLAQNGYRTFVEISAQPTLTGAVTECVEEAGAGAPTVTGTVTREDPGPGGLLTSLARLHVAGVVVDWRAVLGGGERVELPTYAFQNRRYWLQAPEVSGKTDAGHNSEAEAEFWAAVEGGDAERLAGTLSVDDETLAEILPALASWRRRERADSVVSDWRYKVTWAPVSDPGASVLSGTWLVVHPAQQDEATDWCVNALTERGADVVRLQLGAADLDRDAVAARLAQMTAGDNALSGIVSLLALDEAPNPRYPGVATGLAGSLVLTQALGDAGIGARLWIVTQDAVAAAPGDHLTHPTQGQAWGFGRVVGLEHPERWGGLLDLPPEWDDRIAARFTAVLAGIADEDQVAVRAAGILGRRLVRPPKHHQDSGAKRLHEGRRSGEGPAKTWRPRGTVLITGGTGALGNHLGPWLTGRGAERIVLTSRSGPAAAGVAELAAKLAAAGTRVDVVACDTARRDEVAGLLGWITTDGPNLSSVMHAALVFDDKAVAKLELERLDRALAAKVAGARWLDELTAGLNLDAFVMYSSIAATWGAGHEPGYAAGNAYLDALADNRLARGLTATSIAYGPWASGGPTEGDAKIQLARRGLRLLDPPLAIEALARTLDAGEHAVTIADATWEILGPTFSLRRRSPLMEGLPEVRAALAAQAEAEAAVDRAEPVGGELAGRLVGLTPVEQDRLLTEVIRTEAASVLGHTSADAVEAGRAFSDLGFDSLTSVELRNRLNAATGLRLPATLLFDYPTPAVLAEYLRTRALGIQAGPAGVSGTAGGKAPDEPVAIVAMGCRYPGGVAGPEDLWDLVAAGGDAIAGFPTDRGWAQNLYHPDPDHIGTSYVREGGFINAAGEFDAPFFGISPREALAMDPQQRMLLEVSWEALERAGINPQSLKGSRTGVFVGGAESGYQALGMQLALNGTDGIEGHLATGTAGSVLSGRLSYVLGLEGPAVTLDTACSSSLVALHMAAQAVRSGECDLALAGGVTMLATPVVFVGFSRQRGLAFDGRCKAFSEEADGMGMGEGAGMVVLERLSDARRNGHTVLAVIRGSAVNQDGASNGLTAPNGPSQQRVIRAALADGRLTTDDVDVVEAHGTGTPLGDPIEAQALMATYGQDRPAGRPLWLGSVKSNIGHSQSAAGVAGVIKTVMALRHGLMPRTLHAEEPSHEIDWTAGNVRLLQEPVAWPAGDRVRRGGVSAFGMSGTNVHVILEEAPAFEADETTETGDEPETPAVLLPGTVTAWPISGRSADALAGQAGRLREFVLARPGLDPAAVGWSLAAGRAVFGHRAVVVGSERGDLAARLANVATAQDALGVVTGSVPAGGVGRGVFVFPGQGSQWPGMGRELLAVSPVFAARYAECADALDPYVDWSPLDVLQQADGAPTLDSADVAQPVMWAVMVALAAVWQAAGVTPDAVIGHSQGEIAAATVAGILSLDDAARVVVLRSKALAGLGVRGGLLSAVMPESAAHALLRDHPALSVAAVNSPAATVISGPPEDLDRFEAALSKRRVLRWRVPATSDFVAHSPRVRPIEDQLLDGLSGIRPQPGRIAFYSTAYNRWLPGHELNAAYWYANVREQVRFSDAVQELSRTGHRTFIEVSAQPVLTGAIAECVEEAGGPAPVVTGTVTREEPGATGLLTSLARVHVSGTDVDWTTVLTGDRTDLPTYAFQRRRYWLDTPDAAEAEAGAGTAAEARFWAAVEGGDLSGIEDTLAIDPRRPLTELLPALASWRRREREDSAVADWRYRVTWTPLGEPDAAVLAGTWLVVTPAGFGEDETVTGGVRALRERGAEVTTLELGTADLDRAALAAALAEAGGSCSGIVSLLALDERSVAEGVPFGVAGTLLLVQALGDAGITAPLWAVTQGAVSTGSGDPLTHPGQAQIWGLGRVVALEHPERWGGLIDLPATWDDRTAARFSSLIGADVTADGFEDQVAVRATGVHGRRLEHAASASSPTTWQPRGTVLITGGTGALGGHVGRWLTGRGAERVVLTSRSGPGARAIAGLAAELATAGTAVEVAACDTSQRSEVSALLNRIAATGPALSSVVHTAGVGQATMLAETSLAEQASVTAAKTAGAAVLDELTADLELDAFVMFSSIAATWGGGMQPSYAAGNAYLDALAENRRARGLAATSVAWGPWGGGGMTDEEGAEQMARRGLRLMEPRLAVQALAGALDSGEDLLTVADMDWKRFAPVFVLRRPSPLIEALPEVGRALAETENAAPSADGAQPALAEQLTGLPAAEQLRILTDLVRSEAASVLGYPSVDDVEPERAFSELGFDSLTSVDLRNRLSAATGLRLSATLLFDYPNPSVLADHLRAQWFPADAGGLPLLAELDRLDALLSGATPDGELHEQVTARLQRFLATWSGIGTAAGDGAEVAKRIESASDDEIFDFIHRELGRS